MTANGASTAETELRALIEERAEAVRAKDIDGALAHVAPDVVAFDVVNPLGYRGVGAIRQRLTQWLSSFAGPIGYELRDLSITASDDVAFSHSLSQVRATLTNGQKLEMWWRATVCYRKIDGRWLITHEHSSVPFDTATGKASIDLQP
jgi:uncharacterized protein (TIGR02246 family)